MSDDVLFFIGIACFALGGVLLLVALAKWKNGQAKHSTPPNKVLLATLYILGAAFLLIGGTLNGLYVSRDTTRPKEQHWQSYKTDDGKFTWQFPTSAEVHFPKANTRQFKQWVVMRSGNKLYLSVSSYDQQPEFLQLPKAQQHSELEKQLIKRFGSLEKPLTLVKKTELKVDGQLGQRYHFQSANGEIAMIVDSLLLDKNEYRAIVSGPTQLVNSQEAKRFQSSYKILN